MLEANLPVLCSLDSLMIVPGSHAAEIVKNSLLEIVSCGTD